MKIVATQHICGTTLAAAQVTQQVAEAAKAALAAVHANGLLHGNIKADKTNSEKPLLVMPGFETATVLILDPGFAKYGT